MLVSGDGGFFERAWTTFRSLDLVCSSNQEAAVLVDPSGRRFTLCASGASFDGLAEVTGELEIRGWAPPRSQISFYPVECRWENLFVGIVHALAANEGGPLWVLDSHDQLWRASEVEVESIRL